MEILIVYVSLSLPQGFNNITTLQRQALYVQPFDKYLVLACRGNNNAAADCAVPVSHFRNFSFCPQY
uniref:Uncharacterized protein n=1 Tax=Glossina palpalis gambiensis TaxID=67801 RepID=A0A1B0ASQ2_9MUSC